MSAELFDVEINLDGNVILYATKVSSKKNRDTNTTLTFNGDVTTSSANTGGTISIEGLYWPTSVEEAVALENLLNSVDERGNFVAIESITCSGTSYTAGGDAYTRQIIGTGVTVTSDEEEWSPSDGISSKLEFAVNKLQRQSELL